MTVSLFFLEHVSQSCHKGFLKASVGDTKPDTHFKERDHHPTPPHQTSCVASTMSASSRNVIITPPHPCRPPGNPPSLGSHECCLDNMINATFHQGLFTSATNTWSTFTGHAAMQLRPLHLSLGPGLVRDTRSKFLLKLS